MSKRPDRIVIDDPGYLGPIPTSAQLAAIAEAERAARRMIAYGMAAMHGAPVAHISDYWRKKIAA